MNAAPARARPARRTLAALAAGGALGGAACGDVRVPDEPDGGLGTLREGCAVLLRMDEPSWGGPGSVLDECGGDDPGTPRGTITTVADGARGRAGQFNGEGCIEIADDPRLAASTELTLSAWVLPTVPSNIDTALGVISKRRDMNDQSAYNLYLWMENYPWVDLQGNDDRFVGRAALPNNRWAQLTVVYDGARAAGDRVRLYVDGALDVIATETAAALEPSSAPLSIGCMPSPSAGTPQYFEGLLDEVGVWTRALTEAEVGQWYAATKPR